MFEVAMHIIILQTFVVVSLLGCLSLKTFKWRQKQFFFGQGNSNFQDMCMYMYLVPNYICKYCPYVMEVRTIVYRLYYIAVSVRE